MLSQHLPQTVDRMSPNGTLQEPAAQEPDADDEPPAAAGSSLAAQAGLGDVGRRR